MLPEKLRFQKSGKKYTESECCSHDMQAIMVYIRDADFNVSGELLGYWKLISCRIKVEYHPILVLAWTVSRFVIQRTNSTVQGSIAYISWLVSDMADTQPALLAFY